MDSATSSTCALLVSGLFPPGCTNASAVGWCSVCSVRTCSPASYTSIAFPKNLAVAAVLHAPYSDEKVANREIGFGTS